MAFKDCLKKAGFDQQEIDKLVVEFEELRKNNNTNESLNLIFNRLDSDVNNSLSEIKSQLGLEEPQEPLPSAEEFATEGEGVQEAPSPILEEETVFEEPRRRVIKRGEELVAQRKFNGEFVDYKNQESSGAKELIDRANNQPLQEEVSETTTGEEGVQVLAEDSQPDTDTDNLSETALRLLESENLSEETRAELQKRKEEGRLDKVVVDQANREIRGSELIETHKSNPKKIFESGAKDEFKVLALDRLTKRLNDEGKSYEASIAASYLTRLGSQLGANLQSLNTRNTDDTSFTLQAIENRWAEERGKKLQEKWQGSNQTVQQVFEQTVKALNLNEQQVQELAEKLVFSQKLENRLSPDEQIRRGKERVRKSIGLNAIIPAQALPGVVDVVVGLVRKFAGNLTKVKAQFLKEANLENAEELYNKALESSEVKNAVKLEQTVQAIKDHYSQDSDTDLKAKLQEIGLSEDQINDITSRAGKIYRELFYSDVKSKLSGISKSRRKTNEVIKAASEGFLNNDKGLEILHKEFGLPLLTPDTKAAIEQYSKSIEESVAKGGGYNDLKNEQKIREILKTSNSSNAYLIAEAVRDVFMVHILSGLSTQSRALFGAVLGQSGEITIEAARGTIERRSKRLGMNWFKKAWANASTEIGFKAGAQAYSEVLARGSTNLTFAETVDLAEPRSLDIFFNKWDKWNSLGGIAKNAIRGYLAPSILMYRNLIALDYIIKSGVVEFYSWIEAYNKALTQNGQLAGVELLNEVNRILGTSQIEDLKKVVEQEVIDGRTPANKKAARLKQLVNERRDVVVSQNANERAMEALLMNNSTTGLIPAGIRKVASFFQIRPGDNPGAIAAKVFMSYHFPIVRVIANGLTRTWQFSPFGLAEGISSSIAPNIFTQTVFDPKDNSVSGEVRSPEKRKLLLYRGALGTGIGLMGLGFFQLLTGEDDEGKKIVKDKFFKITGPGTGDFLENKDKYGQDYSPLTIQFTGGTQVPLGKLEYMDSPAGSGFMILGYYLDKIRAGEFKKEDEQDLMTSIAMGLYGSTFSYSLTQLQGLGLLLDSKGRKRAALLVSGQDKPQNKQERDFVKTIFDKANSQLYSNLYKQTYRLIEDATDDAVLSGSTAQQRLVRYIPYLHRKLNNEITDSYGLPIDSDFELPFPFEFVSKGIDNMVGAKESVPDQIKEFDKRVKESNLDTPNGYYPRTYAKKIPLPVSSKERYNSEFKKAWGEEIIKRWDKWQGLDDEKLLKAIDKSEQKIKDSIKSQMLKEDPFVSKMWQIDEFIALEKKDKAEARKLVQLLDSIEGQLSKQEYKTRLNYLIRV